MEILDFLIDSYPLHLELRCVQTGDLVEVLLLKGHSSLEVGGVREGVLVILPSAQFFIETHHFVEESLARVLFLDCHAPDIHDYAGLSKDGLILRLHFGQHLFLQLDNRGYKVHLFHVLLLKSFRDIV